MLVLSSEWSLPASIGWISGKRPSLSRGGNSRQGRCGGIRIGFFSNTGQTAGYHRIISHPKGISSKSQNLLSTMNRGNQGKVMDALAKLPKWISVLVLVLPFLAVRGAYYLYHPVAGVYNDTASYAHPAHLMSQGQLPLFDLRTPGYPLVIWALRLFTDSTLAIPIFQSLVALLATGFLLEAVGDQMPWALFPAALGFSFRLTSYEAIRSETAYLTDSLFSSSLTVLFACLLFGLSGRGLSMWLGAGLALGYSIWLRPSGLLLLPVMALVLAFLWWKKHDVKAMLAAAIPVLVAGLSLYLYNFFTLGLFAITQFGWLNLLGATMTYLEAPPNSPPRAQAVVREFQSRISPEEKQILHTAPLTTKVQVFSKHYNATWEFAHALEAEPGKPVTTVPWHLEDYGETYPVIRDVASYSIEQHGDIYRSFVLSSGLAGHSHIGGASPPFHFLLYLHFQPLLQLVANKESMKESPERLAALRYAVGEQVGMDGSLAAQCGFGQRPDGTYVPRMTTGLTILTWNHWFHDLVTRIPGWTLLGNGLLYACIVLAFLQCLGKGRESDASAFALFLGLSHVTVIGLTSLVELCIHRYTWPTNYSYFVCPLLVLGASALVKNRPQPSEPLSETTPEPPR